MTPRPLFTREELVGGELSHNRRAQKVVNAIESRVLYMRDETRRALTAYIRGDFQSYSRSFDGDFLQSVRTRAHSGWQLTADDLERFAALWEPLVPKGDPDIRAAVLQRAASRFNLSLSETPRALDALRAMDEEVGAALLAANGSTPESAFASRAAAPERMSGEQDDDALAVAERAAEWIVLSGGTSLYEPGDPGDSLYIVISGRLRTVSHDGADDAITDVVRGEVVGETEVFTGEVRAEQAYAARDSELLRLPRAALLAISRDEPELLMRVNRDLARRLRTRLDGPRRATTVRSSFALVGARDGAPLDILAKPLCAALAPFGSTLHLSSSVAREHMAEDEPDNDAELTAWLSEQEASHRYVVYEADPYDSAWTRRCLRQADRVLLVARGEWQPDPCQAETLAAGRPVAPQIDLMLVHRPDCEHPTGTAAWLRSDAITSFHHIKEGQSEHIARAARRLTGNAVGVVLGGGGARGYAHIGAMRALAERGVPIDVIGGTSMGAFMGAGFALDRDIATVTRRALASAGRRHLLDATLPMAAFFAGRKLSAVAQREFRSNRIEDLWRPYFCISTNLTQAEAVLHDRGLLWRAIRASAAIPGVFPPLLSSDGDLLVDGGLMNNLPIDLMRQRADVGTVIAIDPSIHREDTRTYQFGPSISGWRAAFGRLPRRTGDTVPGLLSILLRATEVRSVSVTNSAAFRANADLIVRPSIEGYGRLDFGRCAELIEVGYSAAAEALDDWLSHQEPSATDPAAPLEVLP